MAPAREIRVHGVGGATAAHLLDDPDPVQVSGDRAAGFFCPRRQDASHPKEAYVWGGLTSRALITGFWWLLLPFTLANVSGWMIRPMDERLRKKAIRGLIRLSAVVQTVVYVAYVVVIFLDVVSVRCGADEVCADRWWLTPLTWFGEMGDPVWRVTVGGGLVTAVLWLLFGVSARNRRLHETFDPGLHGLRGAAGDGPRSEGPPPGEKATARTLSDRDFWYRPTDRIFRVHLLVATATAGFGVGVALEPAVGQSGWPGGRLLAWVLVVLVAGAAAIAALAKPDPYRWNAGSAEYEHRPGYAGWVGVWVTAHLGAAAAAGLLGWWSRQNATVDAAFAEEGFMKVVEMTAWAYIPLLVLLVMLTVPEERWVRPIAYRMRRLARRLGPVKIRRVATREREIRNRGFRFLPVPAAIGLGLFMTFSGFSAVLVRLTAFLDGANAAGLKTPLMGGNSSNFAFSAVVAAAIGWWWLRRVSSRKELVAAVEREYFPSKPATSPGSKPAIRKPGSPGQARWITRVATTRQLSEGLRNADIPLFGFLLVFTAVLLALNVTGGGATGASEVLFGWHWLESAGSWVLLLYLFPGVFILRAAIRARDTRRTVGKVWDVLTFWPRIYHPLAAPCYAERAVPELRDRILAETGAGNRVILSAHSQGTVIVYAALEQVQAAGPQALERVAVVTYGSPVRSLFAPFFPGYFKTADLERTAERARNGGGWLNFYRDTDYIGKWLFSATEVSDSLPATPDDPPDVRLPDPRMPLLPVQRHSGYEKEPLLEQWISRLAGGQAWSAGSSTGSTADSVSRNMTDSD